MKFLKKLAFKAVDKLEAAGLKVVAWINSDTHGPCDW